LYIWQDLLAVNSFLWYSLEAFMVTTVKSYWTVIHVGFVSNIF